MHRHPMKFHDYLDFRTLPALADSTNWSAAVKVGYGMDGNDLLGDCTCAGPAHNIVAVTANAMGNAIVPTTAQVEVMYEASGYVPGNPSTDQGWTLKAAEGYIVSTGLAGIKADGFVEVDPTSITHMKYALQLLGPTLNFGINLPQSAMDVFQNAPAGQTPVWSVGDMVNTTIIGGHDGAVVDFTKHGNFVLETWCSDTNVYLGRVIVTPEWVLKFVDEVSAMYFKMMASKVGLDVAQMDADAQALAEAA